MKAIRHDTCIKTLQIICKQPDGVYEYIPSGCTVELHIKNNKNKIVYSRIYDMPESNRDRLDVHFPTDLAGGRYTYDIIVVTDTERYTVVNEEIYDIEEDSAYEGLV